MEIEKMLDIRMHTWQGWLMTNMMTEKKTKN